MNKPKHLNYPPAYFRCDACCGTGWLFTENGVTDEMKNRGVYMLMTDTRCKFCDETGYKEYMN